MHSLQDGSGDASVQAKMDALDLKDKENIGVQQEKFSSNKRSGRRRPSNTARTLSQASNGEASDYSVGDLEEAFADTDDESSTEPQKLRLTLPKLRRRTLSGQWPETGYSPKWGGPTMCVSCLEFFNLPEQITDFKAHLLTEHKIVISELEAIVDPKRYIEHWRVRFSKNSIDTIFPRIEVAQGDPLHGQVKYYYHIVPSLEEDAKVRRDLALRRLEEALTCQQRERDDRDFKLGCLFCRYTAHGNRSKMIHHLFTIHHLNLGKPDNLVFVREYLELLKSLLDKNECIYCEKAFPDRNVLMDHMRKRNHREVNPKNHYYDKFYIINYLEVGKRWLDVLAQDFEDNTPAFQDSDDEEEECAWSEWEKDNILDDTRAVCVMCDATDDTLEGLLDHMISTHGLDLVQKTKELSMYQRMKLLNYIRKQSYNGVCWICEKEVGNPNQLAKHFAEEETRFKELPPSEKWDTDVNLIPIFDNDNLLWLLESHLSDEDIVSRPPIHGKEKICGLIEDSKKNTIEGVIAEDLPDLHEITNSEIDTLM